LIKDNLSQSAGLTLRLEEAQDVVLTDWALDVTDDGTGGLVNELDTDLGNTTTGTGATENLLDLSESNSRLSGVHFSGCLERDC